MLHQTGLVDAANPKLRIASRSVAQLYSAWRWALCAQSAGNAPADLPAYPDRSEILDHQTDNSPISRASERRRSGGHLSQSLERAMGSSAASERVRGNVALPPHAFDGLRQIPPDWNDSTADYPADKPMHRLFEEWVERQPDAMALAHGEHRLSYAELNRTANRLARHLVSLGAGPDVLVGLCMHRRVEMIIGLLAVLKA